MARTSAAGTEGASTTGTRKTSRKADPFSTAKKVVKLPTALDVEEAKKVGMIIKAFAPDLVAALTEESE